MQIQISQVINWAIAADIHILAIPCTEKPLGEIDLVIRTLNNFNFVGCHI